MAKLAHQKDKEIILHLPLQASSSLALPEPNALDETMNEVQLTENLNTMLTAFPHIKGINNHMGSRLTEIDYFMRPIMDSIRSYNPGLYFLDSRTTARSVAHIEALNSGLDSVSRDVFLDNDHSNIESIRLQFHIWLEKARVRGSAVAIGHPHASTISFLRDNLSQAMGKFRFISVSKLIDSIYNSEDAYSWNENMPETQSALD